MTVQRVFAAAAALREFDITEISAFCDEQPAAIAEILASAAPAVEPAGDERWRVVDLAAVRRQAGRGALQSAPSLLDLPQNPDARLKLAEETLAACRHEPSPPRRRMMVATATNHLRQVVATTLSRQSPWWLVDLQADVLDRELRQHSDPEVAVRLLLGVVVARLAEGNVTGHPVPIDELIDAVARFRNEPLLGDHRLQGLVGGFVDLVTAQEFSHTAPVDRLIVAVARRRAQAQVQRDLRAAMHGLEHLVRSLGSGHTREPVLHLVQTVGRLPDGLDRAVVYSDLLHVLPAQLRWYPRSEPLPGALIEVVAEPAVTLHLQHCALTLEADLVHSPFGSDTALIGQAAHVFQELAETHASLDRTVLHRAERARSELLELAKASVWPSAADSPEPLPNTGTANSVNALVQSLATNRLVSE